MKLLLLVTIALCVATARANVFDPNKNPSWLSSLVSEPAAKVAKTTVMSTAPKDVSAAFDAVRDFVFTDDLAAFRAGRSSRLRVHDTRRSAHGHPQPFASTLHLAFTAHGHHFDFSQLKLNHHTWDDGFEMRVENGLEGTHEMYRPHITTYTGQSSDGAATANVVVSAETQQVHAHILHHATGRLFRLDHLDRHQHRLGHRNAELTSAAGAHGMVLLRDEHTADDVLLHHDNAGAATAAMTTSAPATPMQALKTRKLLKETRAGKKNSAKRWTSCYDDMGRGYRASIGVAVDHEWYRQAKKWGKSDSEIKQDQKALTALEVAELVSDTNLMYNAQMNIEFTVGQSVVQTTKGGPAWNFAPKYEGRKPRYHFSNQCAQPDSHKALIAFDDWRKDKHKKDRAIWHLLTGCSYDKGVLGIAWVGTLCKQNLSSAITSGFRNGHDDCWKTFAHEIGHNFGAEHSFEEGQGRTGGIMDYGDGKLDGVYQFNTKYRKNEICNVVKKAMKPSWFSFGHTKRCFNAK